MNTCGRYVEVFPESDDYRRMRENRKKRLAHFVFENAINKNESRVAYYKLSIDTVKVKANNK